MSLKSRREVLQANKWGTGPDRQTEYRQVVLGQFGCSLLKNLKSLPRGTRARCRLRGLQDPTPPRQEHCILGEAWSSAPMLPTTSAEG